MSITTIATALSGLRTALQAGGYDLSVDKVVGTNDVQIVVTAGLDACEECVMPDDMLLLMARRALSDEGLPVGEIRLEKIGFSHGG